MKTGIATNTSTLIGAHPGAKVAATAHRRLTFEYSQWIALKKYWRTRAHAYDERWRLDFQAFLDDVGYAPSRLHRLYRLDASLPWQRGNCAWQTRCLTKGAKRYIHALRRGLIK